MFCIIAVHVYVLCLVLIYDHALHCWCSSTRSLPMIYSSFVFGFEFKSCACAGFGTTSSMIECRGERVHHSSRAKVGAFLFCTHLIWECYACPWQGFGFRPKKMKLVRFIWARYKCKPVKKFGHFCIFSPAQDPK